MTKTCQRCREPRPRSWFPSPKHRVADCCRVWTPEEDDDSSNYPAAVPRWWTDYRGHVLAGTLGDREPWEHEPYRTGTADVVREHNEAVRRGREETLMFGRWKQGRVAQSELDTIRARYPGMRDTHRPLPGSREYGLDMPAALRACVRSSVNGG